VGVVVVVVVVVDVVVVDVVLVPKRRQTQISSLQLQPTRMLPQIRFHVFYSGHIFTFFNVFLNFFHVFYFKKRCQMQSMNM